MAAGRTSISRKVTFLVLATTASALLMSALGLVAYDLHAYEGQWTRSLTLQAEILARASAPALSFNDRPTAQKDLSIIRVRTAVLAAALYTNQGELFATYERPGAVPGEIPAHPLREGAHVSGDQIEVFHRVVEAGEPLGTIYLRATYLPWARLADYLAILGVVMVASLALAAAILGWLQRGVTGPILDVAAVARKVMTRRDYSLRAKKRSDDEIGELVDAFNGMLAESERRAHALREADRRKDEFLATLAHELRNPLAPIRNAVQILRLPESTPDMSHRALDMMERQLRQMVRLVDDLFDVSRITTGRLGVRKAPIDLREPLAAAVEMLRPFLAARAQVLEAAIAPEALIVHGDATRLAQVVGNLLHNAAKYSDAGATIVLEAQREGTHAVIRVRDSGIGLAPDSLAEIFDMFVQVDRSLTRTQAGLGVGLTLVRQLVELHAGTVTVESAGLGRGSEFTVRLPLSGEGAQASQPERADGSQEGPIRSRRILLADDNVDLAVSLGAALSGLGHEVRVVHDGMDALATVQAFRPDVVFLDIGMPSVHGYELARRLRRDPETAQCVIVALTGWGLEDDRRRAREAGFDRHLVKPVDAADLQSVLAEADAPDGAAPVGTSDRVR